MHWHWHKDYKHGECVIFCVRLLCLKRVILKFVLWHFEAQWIVLWTTLITRVINITSTQNLAKCNINSNQFPIKFISFQLPSFELKPENLHCIANSLSVGLLSWHVKATIAQGTITAKAECDISSRDFSVSRLFSFFCEYRYQSQKIWFRKKG